MECKTISLKKITDKKENPTMCMSAVRIFNKCHKCNYFKFKLKRYRRVDNAIQHMECKPHITEHVKNMLKEKRRMKIKIELINKELEK